MSRSGLKRLQRKLVTAKQALKSAQSETRLALQLVAQLDAEITAALAGSHAQPEEAQHAHQDTREAVNA